MRVHHFVVIALGLALVGCNRMSNSEARFLKDRRTVMETIRSCYEQPYQGLNRFPPTNVPNNFDFPGEDHILGEIHSGTGWFGDGAWSVAYRPADTNEASRNIEADKVLDFYFSKLEAAGFTSGQRGIGIFASTDAMQTASKTWANANRTLLITASVVSEKRSGETIISAFVSETFSP